MGNPRYLSALARGRLADARTTLLNKAVCAGSEQASTLLFEVAEAASVLMAERAATLHALAYVYALDSALGLVEVAHLATRRGVEASRMLADGRKLEGRPSSEDSARGWLTSHGLSLETARGNVVQLRRRGDE